MGIVYKITCDRCAEEYPEEIDSEMHHGSFFGTHPDDAALEIKKSNWWITMGNEVICPVCGADPEVESDAVDDNRQERLAAASYRLPNGEIFSGKTHVEAWSKVPAGYGRLPLKDMSEEDAVEELKKDCEIHHHIDRTMLSSDARFYEFLYTEVKFHADCWGLDFETAREVYEVWAWKKRRDFCKYED